MDKGLIVDLVFIDDDRAVGNVVQKLVVGIIRSDDDPVIQDPFHQALVDAVTVHEQIDIISIKDQIGIEDRCIGNIIAS